MHSELPDDKDPIEDPDYFHFQLGTTDTSEDVDVYSSCLEKIQIFSPYTLKEKVRVRYLYPKFRETLWPTKNPRHYIIVFVKRTTPSFSSSLLNIVWEVTRGHVERGILHSKYSSSLNTDKTSDVIVIMDSVMDCVLLTYVLTYLVTPLPTLKSL